MSMKQVFFVLLGVLVYYFILYFFNTLQFRIIIFQI